MKSVIRFNDQGVAFLQKHQFDEALEMFQKAASLLYTSCASRNQRKSKTSPSNDSSVQQEIHGSQAATRSTQDSENEPSRSNEQSKLGSYPDQVESSTNDSNPNVDRIQRREKRQRNQQTASSSSSSAAAAASPQHREENDETPPTRRATKDESCFLWNRPFVLDVDKFDCRMIEADFDHPDWIVFSIMIMFNMALTYQLSCEFASTTNQPGSSVTERNQKASKLYSLCFDLAMKNFKKEKDQKQQKNFKDEQQVGLDMLIMASLNNLGVLKRDLEADYERSQYLFDFLANYVHRMHSRRKQRMNRSQQKQGEEGLGNRSSKEEQQSEVMRHYFSLNSTVLRNRHNGAAAA